MYLDYAKIDSSKKTAPMLRLRTLAGQELGAIPYVYGLSFEINYSDVSTIEFTVPHKVDGKENPMYDLITSYKVVYTDCLGIYILTSPRKSGDGVEETKEVTGYSLEQLFANKNLYLEEGTFNFWSPADQTDTILSRVLELDPTWSVGYVAPRLIGCYRTFDEYDNTALSFCYNDASEKYRAVFVFDVYERTINVYDADSDTGTLPIYLSYENLVDSIQVDENVDDMVTKLHLYGSDSLTIRNVNPIGTDYIINLDYFLTNGDLDIAVGDSNATLADRVKSWEASIYARQSYYTGLVSMRASLTAQKLTANAELTDLQGELETLTSQQNITIQALALETTDDGITYQQSLLDDINAQITSKNAEITAKQNEIDTMTTNIETYATDISAVVSELSYSTYFTEDEQKVLNQYLIEGDLEEETFVATDVDTSVSGTVSAASGTVSVSDSSIASVTLEDYSRTMYVISGGNFSLGDISGEIIRGTLDVDGSNSYVFSGYLGTVTYNSESYSSGLITISGTLFGFTSDIAAVSTGEVVTYEGTSFSFATTSATVFFTVDVSDYQEYSVAMELYEFGMDALDDYAWPVYEFEIDSANFLYQEAFEPFKNELELGKSVYLKLGSEGLLTAKIIGIQLNYDDIGDFELIFSNQYQRKNKVVSWIEEMESTSASSRSFDASKYIYNKAASKTSEVDEFMTGQLNAAVNNIVNKSDQTVLINSAGINIGGDSNYQIRLVDNMIAMTDDDWQTVKLAIGLFASEDTGTQWGVNAEVIAGKLIVGNNLVLENTTDTGVMQFKVDSTGAWLNNSTFVLQKDGGGKILIDPDYGIIAGTSDLYTTSGTTVTPSFVSSGSITYDSDGMPTNSNFFLDLTDGSAYFRGKIQAESGEIGGWTIADSYLYAGSGSSYVALNASGTYNSAYAFWAGAESPANAKFWVKKDGSFTATNGTFSGTLNASTIAGTLTAGDNGKIVGCEIYVPNESSPKFKVDSSGNVTMAGNLTTSGDITLGGDISLTGSITWGSSNSPVKALYARTELSTPTGSYSSYSSSSTSNWHRTLNSAYDYYASYSYDGGSTWTAAILFQGSDGADGSDADVTRGNIAKALYEKSDDYMEDGIYSYLHNGEYYIAINASYITTGELNADLITTGTIDATNVTLGSRYGGFTCARGNDGNGSTIGAKMYGSDEDVYFIATGSGVRMRYNSSNTIYCVSAGVFVWGKTFYWNGVDITSGMNAMKDGQSSSILPQD